MDANTAIEVRDRSIAFLQTLGYRVTKPKAKAKAKARPLLNAIGKPFSPSYDPNYKMRRPRTSIRRLYAPMGNAPWVKDDTQTELAA